MNIQKELFRFFALLGPGLLFAGAAVGVSHLVVSTRAGATYGFGLIWLVVLANLMKYPFFEYGPRYAMATGESLLEGYKRMGKWVLWIFVAFTLGTMFTIQAAVTVVTAGLASCLFGLSLPVMAWAAIILLLCASILIVGRYGVLDSMMKVIIISLTIITVIAVVLATLYHNPQAAAIDLTQHISIESSALAFYVTFTGWMPAPLDLSVWHSIWTLEKRKLAKEGYTAGWSSFDFNVGYIGTTILAILFLSLGALIMYGTGEKFATDGAGFAKQLIHLYTDSLGSGAGLFVSIAAFITMFSTTITCLDAIPRSISRAQVLLFPKAKNWGRTVGTPLDNSDDFPRVLYLGWMIILLAGTLLLLSILHAGMAGFVVLATVLSFLTTPFFAIVNTILINSTKVPDAAQPPLWMQVLSWIGILYLFIFVSLYFWVI